MTWSDLIIIYLACGSPVGVHEITKQKKESFPVIAAAFLFWPVVVVLLLAGKRLKDLEILEPPFSEQIRTAIERLAFAGGSTISLFEFRDVFYRYTGITEAVNSASEKGADRSYELFEIGGRRDNSVAVRCLVRRSRERLAFHRVRTQHEFIQLILQLARSSNHRDAIIGQAAELAIHLSDTEAAGQFSHELHDLLKNSVPPISKAAVGQHVSVAG